MRMPGSLARSAVICFLVSIAVFLARTCAILGHPPDGGLGVREMVTVPSVRFLVAAKLPDRCALCVVCLPATTHVYLWVVPFFQVTAYPVAPCSRREPSVNMVSPGPVRTLGLQLGGSLFDGCLEGWLPLEGPFLPFCPSIRGKTVGGFCPLQRVLVPGPSGGW